MGHKISSIQDLNNLIWYRVLKVFYILILFALSILVVFTLLKGNYTHFSPYDYGETKIHCYEGSNKTITASEAGISFVPKDFKQGELIGRTHNDELTQACGISEDEHVASLRDAVSCRMKGLPSCRLQEFFVEPVLRTGVNWWVKFCLYSISALFGIGVFLELIRRIIYYVILGTIRPKVRSIKSEN